MINDDKMRPQGNWPEDEYVMRSTAWTGAFVAGGRQYKQQHLFLITTEQKAIVDTYKKTGEELFLLLSSSFNNLARQHNGVQNDIILPASKITSPDGTWEEGYWYDGKKRATILFNKNGERTSGRLHYAECIINREYHTLTPDELRTWNPAHHISEQYPQTLEELKAGSLLLSQI